VIQHAIAVRMGISVPMALGLKAQGKEFENFVGDDEAAPSGKPSYTKTGDSAKTQKEDLSDDPIA